MKLLAVFARVLNAMMFSSMAFSNVVQCSSGQSN